MLAARDQQRVDQRGARDDRGAVLVVVEHGDVERLDQPALDLEALRRPDVLEVDASEGRRDQLDGADDLVDVLAVDLDVEDVDVGEALEQHGLAFHDGFSRQRAEVAQPEHGGAVADDRDEIRLGRVLVDLVRVARDLAAGLRDPWGVGHREVHLRHGGLGGNDLELPGSALRVVAKGLLSRDHVASSYASDPGGSPAAASAEVYQKPRAAAARKSTQFQRVSSAWRSLACGSLRAALASAAARGRSPGAGSGWCPRRSASAWRRASASRRGSRACSRCRRRPGPHRS